MNEAKVKNAADKAAKAAEQATQAVGRVQKLVNDPGKIDNFVLRVLIYLVLVVVSIYLWRNVEPYSTFIAQGMGLDSPNGFYTFAGAIAFALVQYLEIWPWLLPKDAPNNKRVIRYSVSLIFFVIDIVACVAFWPLTKEGIDVPGGLMLVSFISWGNLLQFIVTVFGLTLWFALRSWVRKAA